MADPAVVEDLLVRARTGSLSDAEQRLLRERLATSLEDRLLFEAGTEFDQEAPVLPGDELRVQRLARAVERRRGRSAFRLYGKGGLASAAGLGLLLGAFTVSALELARTFLAPSAVPAPPQAKATEPRVENRLRRAHSGTVTPSASPPPTPNLADPEPERRAMPAASTKDRSPGTRGEFAPHTGESAVSAGALFAEASRARMRGEAGVAIALYERLLAEFPGSIETSTARLSLAMLYAQTGEASRAIEQFRAYRRTGSGVGVAEALWGEAQVLRQLGRASEERAVLEELLRRYPQSAYAGPAEKYLAEPAGGRP